MARSRPHGPPTTSSGRCGAERDGTQRAAEPWKACRVLVAGDDSGRVEPLRNALVADFNGVETSIDADAAVLDFERVLPDVVVLAFERLGSAQQRALQLLGVGKAASARAYGLVVLCGAGEADAAFELCKIGTFDDYVIADGGRDTHRLSMAVWNSAGRVLSAGSGTAAAQAPLADSAALLLAEGAGRKAPPRPLVLVVEDDPLSARLIARTLDAQDFDLEFAAGASEAAGWLRRQRPAVILMDVDLPDMDGLMLTETLKTHARHGSIPIVMITGDARRETIERSVAAGAAGFVVKPSTRDSLLAKISRFLHEGRRGPARSPTGPRRNAVV